MPNKNAPTVVPGRVEIIAEEGGISVVEDVQSCCAHCDG